MCQRCGDLFFSSLLMSCIDSSLKQCDCFYEVWYNSEHKNTILDHNCVVFLWKFDFFEKIHYYVNESMNIQWLAN